MTNEETTNNQPAEVTTPEQSTGSAASPQPIPIQDDGRRSYSVNMDDEHLTISIPLVSVKERKLTTTRTNKDGEKITSETGVTERSFKVSFKKDEMQDGKSSEYRLPDGTFDTLKSLNIKLNGSQSSVVQQEGLEKALKRFQTYLRIASGYNGKTSKKYQEYSFANDLVDLPMLQSWVAGGRKIKSRVFDALPPSVQQTVYDIMTKLGDKQVAAQKIADSKGEELVENLVKLIEEAKVAGIEMSEEDAKKLAAFRAARNAEKEEAAKKQPQPVEPQARLIKAEKPEPVDVPEPVAA